MQEPEIEIHTVQKRPSLTEVEREEENYLQESEGVVELGDGGKGHQQQRHRGGLGQHVLAVLEAIQQRKQVAQRCDRLI